MVLNNLRQVWIVSTRAYKNFGHKRQPIPGVTLLWHGFLTFTFIGLGIEWKKIASFIFGVDHDVEQPPWDYQGKLRATEEQNTRDT